MSDQPESQPAENALSQDSAVQESNLPPPPEMESKGMMAFDKGEGLLLSPTPPVQVEQAVESRVETRSRYSAQDFLKSSPYRSFPQIGANEALKTIDRYFSDVSGLFFANPGLQSSLSNQLLIARSSVLSNDLFNADTQVRGVYVAIESEKQRQREDARLRRIVPLIVFFYIAAIVASIVLGGTIWVENATIPVIGVPLSALVWAAIGSLAAILYRFYTRKTEQVVSEIRWLIARPIIGIIMGALAYLAIVSGLLIFGSTTAENVSEVPARPELLWVVAFLGGFSDRFFESVIGLVAGRFSSRDSASP